MVKKSSALLLILLIITIIGAVALTLSRSIIAGVGFTTNVADSITAEQASRAGLQYGLLQFKNGITNLSSADGNKTLQDPPDKIYFIVTINTVDGITTIKSTGYAGSVVKKYKLTQRMIREEPLSFFTGNGVELQAEVSPDEVLECPAGYVAVGTGHWKADAPDAGATVTRQFPWLKCSELAPGINLSATDKIDWDSIYATGRQNMGWKSQGSSYALTKISHFKTVVVNKDSHPTKPSTWYYEDWSRIGWTKISSGAVTIGGSKQATAPDDTAVWKGDCGQFGDDFVLIGAGHFETAIGNNPGNSHGFEKERITCVPLVPR